MSLLIAIEGIDGSGKGTQAALLQQALQQTGLRVALLSFPRYRETRCGERIGAYLNGDYGTLDAVHPVLVSMLFAGDRAESLPVLAAALAEHDVVLCDRYVASNMAHQGAKAADAQRHDLLNWIEFVEFGLFHLPRPDLVLWLDLPVPQAQQLIAKKSQRSYTDRTHDLQEADAAYLERVRLVYAELAATQPEWQRVEVSRVDVIRPAEVITEELLALVLNKLETSRGGPQNQA